MNERRTILSPLRRYDLLSLGYFAVISAVVTIFHNRVHDWYAFPAAYAIAAIIVWALATVHQARPDDRIITFARWAYPLMLSIVVYGSIDRYVLVFRGHFLDAGMNGWEQHVFGGHPNVMLDRIVSPPLTEFLYACYFGFYLFFLIPPVYLFARRRYADLERYVFALLSALYVCYLGFLVAPLAGPGTSLAGRFQPAELTGYVIVPLQKFIQAKGDPIGACFPSAHVAGAWTAMFAIWCIFGRKVFWRLFPFAVGLTVAVVYTRYHYLSDAIAGFLLAVAVFTLVRRSNWHLVAGPQPQPVPVEPGVGSSLDTCRVDNSRINIER
jgi:membrane-associated phospholipid phosphatase